MKYPIRSNWISWKKNGAGTYSVKNHIIEDAEFELSGSEITFLRLLNGKRNPLSLAKKYLGMSERDAVRYLANLNDIGFIRSDNRVFNIPGMRTVLKVYNSRRFCGPATVMLAVMMIVFLPVMGAGVFGAWEMISNNVVIESAHPYLLIWGGFLLGSLIGLVLHESAHAVAALAFGASVMEFGVSYDSFPGAYTLIDNDSIKSRPGRIIMNLAGIQMNFIIAALSIFGAAKISGDVGEGILFMVAVTNLEMAILNLVPYKDSDGAFVLNEILGAKKGGKKNV